MLLLINRRLRRDARCRRLPAAVLLCFLIVLMSGCGSSYKNYTRRVNSPEQIDAMMKQDGVLLLSEVQTALNEQASTQADISKRMAVLSSIGLGLGAIVTALGGGGFAVGYLMALDGLNLASGLHGMEKNTLKTKVSFNRLIEITRYRNQIKDDLFRTRLRSDMNEQAQESFMKPLKSCPWRYILFPTLSTANNEKTSRYIYSQSDKKNEGAAIQVDASSWVGDGVAVHLKYGLDQDGSSLQSEICGEKAAEAFFEEMIKVIAGKAKPPAKSPVQVAAMPTGSTTPGQGIAAAANAPGSASPSDHAATEEEGTPAMGYDERFTTNSDGTILDRQTGLVWAAKDNGEDISWKNADKYCREYRAGGYEDWRLPTHEELASLYARGMPPTRTSCRPEWKVQVATDLINISCPWVWASEEQDSKADG